MKKLLGSEEFKLWLFDQRTPLNVVVAVRVSDNLRVVDLEQALEKLLYCHPMLSVKIENRDGRLRFVSNEAAQIPFEILVRDGDNHWLQVIEKELSHRLPIAEGIVSHLILLSGEHVSELVVCIHHTITDALGAFTLLQDLLVLLTGGKIISRSMMPAFEELIPEDAFSKTEIATLRNRWWSRRMGEYLTTIDWNELVDSLPAVGKTRVVADTLEPETVERLLARCRQEQTTMHGALTASALLSLAEAVECTCSHSVSLRQRLTPPFGDEVGLCLSHVMTQHRIVPNMNFWDLARDVRYQITEAIKQGEAFDHALDVVRELTSETLSKMEPESLVTMTNPGRIPLDSYYGDLHIIAAISSGSVVVNHPIVSTATFDSRMYWLFCYPSNWSRAEEAVELSRSAIDSLLSAVS